MPKKKNSLVVGVFADRAKAQEAVRALKEAGFTDKQIGVITQGNKKDLTVTDGAGSNIAEGAAIGAATGAGVGALWALGMAAGLLPGIGPAVAGGILASLLASAAGAAAVGGLAGAPIGLGIPEEEAHYYESELKAGRTIVTVKANSRTQEAWEILQRFEASRYDAPVVAAATATKSTGRRKSARTETAAAGTAKQSEEGKTVQVREEQLKVRKKPAKAGEVTVRKEVVEEQQTVEVPVTREEVVIERRPASGSASASDLAPGQEVRIPIREEQVEVGKDTVVKEEVSVRKRKTAGTKKVTGSVRREEVKVEPAGNVVVEGDPPATVKPKRSKSSRK